MKNKEISIPIEDIKKDFESFLSKKNNSKIFFSGKYGIGKTYFLKDFFSKENEKYEVFHLFPINYQIQDRNIDILDLLKYDILIELLNKKEDIFKNDNNSDINIIEYIKKIFNTNDFLQGTISTIIEPIPKIGKILGKPLKEMLEFDKKFQKFKKGDKGKIDDFFEKIKNENILETDYISYILNKKITELKCDKKSILILDDLDRLDPENIFRLLNIFSSFYDQNDVNKFGFDRIILVADYDNLKHIFHHKYGEKTDFSGYIDKFHSIDPYYFDNSKAVINMVDEIISAIQISDKNLDGAIGDSGYIRHVLKYFFIQSTKNNILNLRKLLKAIRNQLKVLEEGNYFSGPFNENKKENIFNISLEILLSIFDNNTELLLKIQNIIKSKNIGKEMQHMPFEYYIEIMLKVLKIEITDDDKGTGIKNKYIIKNEKGTFLNIKIIKGNKEKLFLELLYDYIKQGEYKKGFNDYNY